MSCKNIVITGCNRPTGIGFGLVKLILERFKPLHLFATCRKPSQAKELNELASLYENLHIVELDVTNTDKYPELAAYVDKVTEGDGINLLINNAGIFDKPQDSICILKKDAFLKHLDVNLLSPMFLTQAFIPLLEKAASKSSAPVGIYKATVVNVTTKMASIEDNSGGGAYYYRTSKAALNMATKSLSLELERKGILTVLMHPGWVQTDMGGPNGILTTQESVSGIVSVLEKLNSEANGKFLQYDGKEIPW